MQEEIWKDVVGYEGHYQVSSLGRVRSIKAEAKILSLPIGNRYKCVCLVVNGKQKTITVHKLVALAFLGPRPKDLVIDHKDNNQMNNNLYNLQYITHRLNTSKDRVRKEKMLTGVYRSGYKFVAQKIFSGKFYQLGTFSTEIEAHNMYLKTDEESAKKYIRDRDLNRWISWDKGNLKFSVRVLGHWVGRFKTMELATEARGLKMRELGVLR